MNISINKSSLEVLKKARKLISTGEHWCQGTSARTKDGYDCNPENSNAFYFCALGAFSRAGSDNFEVKDEIACFLDNAGKELYDCQYINLINDEIGLDAVLTCYDYTIDKMKFELQKLEKDK